MGCALILKKIIRVNPFIINNWCPAVPVEEVKGPRLHKTSSIINNSGRKAFIRLSDLTWQTYAIDQWASLSRQS